MTRRPRPTLATVARHAAVSVATVSKVLNGRADVSAATRARVELAMTEVGYLPSTPKRLFAAEPSLAVVFDSLANAYSAQVLEGVLAGASQRGAEVCIDVLSAVPEGRPAPWTDEWIRRSVARGRSGVVAVTTHVDDATAKLCAELGLPLVSVDPPRRPGPLTVSIGSTSYLGAVEGTEHLIALGHRRIAFLSGPASSDVNAERLAGCRSALGSHGLPEPEALVRATTMAQAVADATMLLTGPDRATGLICGNDVVALGALEAARRVGLTIPADVSVVGFDDTHLAEWAVPPLTTVRQPIREMGALAARTALDLAAGQRPPARHQQLSTTLVVRSSTGPAPEAQGAA
ncbi:MAG: LacI family transcriptional regulator [Cellulomonadaceae bacterium]|nr:LacI family transcriptional regulator [Cellulomonadaceae bacterium]